MSHVVSLDKILNLHCLSPVPADVPTRETMIFIHLTPRELRIALTLNAYWGKNALATILNYISLQCLIFIIVTELLVGNH